MFAGDFYAPRKIRLVDIPLEEARVSAQPGEPRVLFEPKLACLCGSDLLFYEGDYPEYRPHVGQSLHEMVGEVVESECERFRPGDRVLTVPYEHFGFYQRYWVAASRVVPLDPRPSPAEALMSQPLGTVVYALKSLPNVLDRDVAVMGQGPMGLLFTAALRNLGARHIIGVDPVAERREVSRIMGATEVIDPEDADVAEAVAEITDGGADIVIEAVGHREQVLPQCVSSCRPHGTILFFGVPTETIDGVPMREAFLKNLRIVTSVNPDFRRDFPLAMRWIGEGRLDVAPLITHRYPLEQIEAAFELFHGKREGAVKVLIEIAPFAS